MKEYCSMPVAGSLRHAINMAELLCLSHFFACNEPCINGRSIGTCLARLKLSRRVDATLIIV